MNIKLISKALHTLSLLSDEDVAIVVGLRNASEDERGILMLALEPNSKPQKKSSKKAAGGGGRSSSKSARASGMAAQLNAQLGGRRQETAAAMTNADAECSSCVYVFGHNVHHLPSVEGYQVSA